MASAATAEGAGGGTDGKEGDAGKESGSVVLTWSDLSQAQTDALLASKTVEEQHKLLGDLLGIIGHEHHLRKQILLDFLFYNLQYAKEHSFSAEQTSAFFSIMKATLQASQASRTSWVPLPESFAIFKGHCLNHSIPNAKTGAKQLFTVEEVKELTAFVTQSFYRHYKAYSVVFCEKQTVVPVARDAVVETPMRPTPLNDANQESGGITETVPAGGKEADAEDTAEA